MSMSPKQKEAYEDLYWSPSADLPSPSTRTAMGATLMMENARSRYPPLNSNPYYVSDPHPWNSDLRAMQRMLEGEIDLPHGKLETSTDGFGIVFVSQCDVCRKAFSRRFEYTLQKDREKKVVLFPTL